MKFTFTLLDPDAPAAREKIVLESRAGESPRHIALKVLAYALFRGEAGGLPLRIEQGVGQRHKPDLVATDPETGRVRLWIDCGQIETKRLGRIASVNHDARIVVLKPTAGEALAYGRAALRYLPPLGRPGAARSVTFAGFDEPFLPAFLDALRGANTLVVARREDGGAPGDLFCVSLNGEAADGGADLHSRLTRFDAAALARGG